MARGAPHRHAKRSPFCEPGPKTLGSRLYESILSTFGITQEEWVEGRGKDAAKVRKTKIKLYNKLDALEKLARHLKLYDGAIEHERNHTHSQAVHVSVEEIDAEIEEMFKGISSDLTPRP